MNEILVNRLNGLLDDYYGKNNNNYCIKAREQIVEFVGSRSYQLLEALRGEFPGPVRRCPCGQPMDVMDVCDSCGYQVMHISPQEVPKGWARMTNSDPKQRKSMGDILRDALEQHKSKIEEAKQMPASKTVVYYKICKEIIDYHILYVEGNQEFDYLPEKDTLGFIKQVLSRKHKLDDNSEGLIIICNIMKI